MDFWDFNVTFPKDDVLLPVTELMIDATTIGHEALSFVNYTIGYN